MKNIKIYILILLSLTIIGSCKRQGFKDSCNPTIKIFVEVNWAESGINPTKENKAYTEVHRVSMRFFPKDGSEPFECYLEESVHNGFIEVPIGEYSIMAMNESVHDVYWHDIMDFTDINDYNKIAAMVAPKDPSSYKFYTPADGELFMTEAHKLASWSIDDFNVTADMIQTTNGNITKIEENYFTINVDMRRLTYDTKVVLTAKNLKSALAIQGAMRGFSQKVYLSSAKTEVLPATQFFKFGGYTYDEGSIWNGTAEAMFQTFAKLPEGTQAEYTMLLDVLLVDGSAYLPDIPFDYVLTDVVNPQNGALINIAVSIELPEKTGDENVSVGDWDDEEHIDL